MVKRKRLFIPGSYIILHKNEYTKINNNEKKTYIYINLLISKNALFLSYSKFLKYFCFYNLGKFLNIKNSLTKIILKNNNI